MTLRGAAALAARAVMMTGLAVSLGYVDFHLAQLGLLPAASTYVLMAGLAAWGAVVAVQSVASSRMLATVIAVYANHVPVLVSLLAVVVFTFVFALLPSAYWLDGPMYLLYPAYDAAIVALSMLLAVHRLHRSSFRSYFAAAFLVLLASVLYDAVVPGTFSYVYDRAAGFAGNPNTAAFVLVLLCVAVLDLDRFRVADPVMLGLTGLGVFLTFSRAGGLLFLFLFTYYASRMLRRPDAGGTRVRRAGLLLAAPVVLATGAFVMVQRAEIFSLSFQPRMAMLRGESDPLPWDEDRIGAAREAWELVSRSPVLGYGTGYSYSLRGVTPHNMYLQQWMNNGLPGLAAYLALLAAAAVTFSRRRDRRGVLFILIVALNGFFSHNVLEERAFLILLGALLSLSFFSRHPALGATIEDPRLRPAAI